MRRLIGHNPRSRWKNQLRHEYSNGTENCRECLTDWTTSPAVPVKGLDRLFANQAVGWCENGRAMHRWREGRGALEGRRSLCGDEKLQLAHIVIFCHKTICRAENVRKREIYFCECFSSGVSYIRQCRFEMLPVYIRSNRQAVINLRTSSRMGGGSLPFSLLAFCISISILRLSVMDVCESSIAESAVIVDAAWSMESVDSEEGRQVQLRLTATMSSFNLDSDVCNSSSTLCTIFVTACNRQRLLLA